MLKSRVKLKFVALRHLEAGAVAHDRVRLYVAQCEVLPPRRDDRWRWCGHHDRIVDADVDVRVLLGIELKVDVDVVDDRLVGAGGVGEGVITGRRRQRKRVPELQAEVALRTEKCVNERAGGGNRRLVRGGEALAGRNGLRDEGGERVVATGLEGERRRWDEGEGASLHERWQQRRDIDLDHVGVGAGDIEDVVERGEAGGVGDHELEVARRSRRLRDVDWLRGESVDQAELCFEGGD